MKNFVQKKLKDQKGMTLIELLAVIVIIAIIAAIAIPAIGNIIENSRVGAVKSDAINIINAAQLYKTESSAGTSVTLGQLETAGLIDDAGSFETAIKTGTGAVTVNLTNNTLSGANAPLSGIVLTFSNASIAAINGLPNGTDAGGTSTPTGVTVTSR